jgi:hypothetical protein
MSNGNKPYEKTCTFCKEKIRMALDNESKWKPFNLNNGPHNCKEKQQDTKKVNQKVTILDVINKLNETIAMLNELVKEPDYIK